MRQGLASWQATGAELYRSYWLALLAEAYGKAGQTEEGLTVLAEALAVVNKNSERFYEAELYRLKGELLLMQAVGAGSIPDEFVGDAPTEAETCFRQAIDISRCQSAKSLELRAGMSFGRRGQIQGKKEEARKMLAGIYGWVHGGVGT